jgi:hypothetical protein
MTYYGETLPWLYFTEQNFTIDDPQDHANKWGLYNMHGNLEEWCWDWADDYDDDDVTDPRGAADSVYDYYDGKITRGGSYWDSAEYLRSASRYYYEPEYDFDIIGFRVVRNGDGPAPKATSAVYQQSAPAKQALRILQQKRVQNFEKKSASYLDLKALRRERIKK